VDDVLKGKWTANDPPQFLEAITHGDYGGFWSALLSFFRRHLHT
jgi:hypothetical protein